MGKYIAVAVWFALALLAYAFTLSNANACKNWLVGAFNSTACTEWTFWHTVSAWAMAAAVITAVIMRIFDRGTNAS